MRNVGRRKDRIGRAGGGKSQVQDRGSRYRLGRLKDRLLGRDRASLYKVETRTLKQVVQRNMERFPTGFMFELTAEKLQNWRSQFVTSSRGGARYVPMAFTEQGVAMLSSVLRSRREIQVNIQIMRAYIQLRRMLTSYAELRAKIEKMEDKYDRSFQVVFEAIKKLMEVEARPKRKIRFTAKVVANEIGRTKAFLRNRKELARSKSCGKRPSAPSGR